MVRWPAPTLIVMATSGDPQAGQAVLVLFDIAASGI